MKIAKSATLPIAPPSVRPSVRSRAPLAGGAVACAHKSFAAELVAHKAEPTAATKDPVGKIELQFKPEAPAAEPTKDEPLDESTASALDEPAVSAPDSPRASSSATPVTARKADASPTKLSAFSPVPKSAKPMALPPPIPCQPMVVAAPMAKRADSPSSSGGGQGQKSVPSPKSVDAPKRRVAAPSAASVESAGCGKDAPLQSATVMPDPQPKAQTPATIDDAAVPAAKPPASDAVAAAGAPKISAKSRSNGSVPASDAVTVTKMTVIEAPRAVEVRPSAATVAAPAPAAMTPTNLPPHVHTPKPAAAEPPSAGPATSTTAPDWSAPRGHIGNAHAEIVVGEGADRVTLRITAAHHSVRVEALATSPELSLALQNSHAELRSQLSRHGLELADFSAGSQHEQSAESSDGGGQGRRPRLPNESDQNPTATPTNEPARPASGVRVVA